MLIYKQNGAFCKGCGAPDFFAAFFYGSLRQKFDFWRFACYNITEGGKTGGKNPFFPLDEPFKNTKIKEKFIRRYEPWTIEVEATINPDYLVAARALLTERAEINALFVRKAQRAYTARLFSVRGETRVTPFNISPFIRRLSLRLCANLERWKRQN